MVDLTLAFFSWNRRYLLHNVLHNALRNKFPFKLIFIDNASTDGSREYLQEHKDEIDELILNKRNMGCVAINQAIRHAEGNYICINADDHILPPKWAGTMYRTVKTVETKIKRLGYISSAIHYAIAKKGSMKYLRTHKLPYEHWFDNPQIRIDSWKGTHERKTCSRAIRLGKIVYRDALAVGAGGTIFPLKTFKKLGLFRTYGLRGLYDGEFRTRCKQYGLRVGYTPNTAFIHVKEMFLNPERYKAGYRSVRPTPEQKVKLRRDWRENKKSAKKGIPPPSAPKLG